MLDFVENDYQTLNRLIGKRGSEVLNSLTISEEKDVISLDFEKSDLSPLNSTFQKDKSLEFPVAKKWSPCPVTSVGNNNSDKSDDLENCCDSTDSPKTRIKHKILNSYGDVKGVKVGDWWNSRLECSYAGAHRPAFASVHSGRDGVYSLALSSCTSDDGFYFTYNGQKNSPRNFIPSKFLVADGSNRSLMKSIETRNPIRVIRGYKLNNAFAPLRGYRYDGLYTVEKFWTCQEAFGSLAFKFLMKRCENQVPAPWEFDFNATKHQNHSIKKSPSKLQKAGEDSIDQYEMESLTEELPTKESSEGSEAGGFADDNKENSTLNIADRLLCDDFDDSSIFSSLGISLPHSTKNGCRKNKRSNKRKLPRTSKSKQTLKRLSEGSTKNIGRRCSDPIDCDDEPSEPFRGFAPELYPRKMILLGFLIHKMQSKLLNSKSALLN